jgi:hypothetical protein
MEDRSNTVAASEDGGSASSVLQSGEDWRLAREAHKDLETVAARPANLLLTGPAGTIRIVLEMMWLELREPILKWRPGQPLELPSPAHAATLVLHDVSELTSDDQQCVLRWLDHAAGGTRVVSTTAVALWPRVKAGAFNDVLYYRLNTVCVDVGASAN